MLRFATHRMLYATTAAAVLVGAGAVSAALVANATPTHPAAANHPAGLTSSAPVTVVASGLNNPRALTWGPRGQLLVAEAGTKPTLCQGTGLAENCFGMTGSISDISSGTPVRIITGLASNYSADDTVGPDGLTYADGKLYTLETQSPQAVASGLPAGLATGLKTEYGALLNVSDGSASVVANPGNVDYQWTQAHKSLSRNFPDADPYAVTSNGNGGFYLADAGANTLDSVDRYGHVHVLAYLPSTPAGADAVPTCVAVGPDHAVYVGQLTGAGSPGTAANVYRYTPWNGSLTVWQSGFSTMTGCGFGAHGNFYVTEFDTTGFPPSGAPAGEVIQISPSGTRTVLGAGKLFAPNGFLAGPDGSIYVSNNSIFAGTGTPSGEVVKIG